jgi:hypothetical protein
MSVVDETATETATAYNTGTIDVEDGVYCDTVWACLLNDYLLDARETGLDQKEDGSAKIPRRKKKKKKVKRRKDPLPDYPSLVDHQDSEAKKKAGEDEPLQIINVDDIYDVRQIRSLDQISEEPETLIEQIIRQTRSLDDSGQNKSFIGINHIPEEAETLFEQIETLERKNVSRVLRLPEQEEGPVVGTQLSASRFIKRAQPLGHIKDGSEPACHSRSAGYVEVESARHYKPVVSRRDTSDDERQHKPSLTPSLPDDNRRRSKSRSGADSRMSLSRRGDPYMPLPISSPVLPAPAPVEIQPTVTRRPVQDRADDHVWTIDSDDKSTKSVKSEGSRSCGPLKPEDQREPESPDPPVDRMGTQDHPIEVGWSNASSNRRRAQTYDDREMSSRSSRDWGEAEFVPIEKTEKNEKKTLKVYNDDAILQRLNLKKEKELKVYDDDAILQRLNLKKEKEGHMKRKLERKAALSRIRSIKERLLQM